MAFFVLVFMDFVQLPTIFYNFGTIRKDGIERWKTFENFSKLLLQVRNSSWDCWNFINIAVLHALYLFMKPRKSSKVLAEKELLLQIKSQELPKSARRSRSRRVNSPKYAKDTFVKKLSSLQCVKIPQGIRIRLGHHFFLTWNLKHQKLFFFGNEFEIFFVGQMSHSALAKRFSRPKTFIKVKRDTLWLSEKFIEKKTGSVDNWGFFNISDGMHQENWMGGPMVKKISEKSPTIPKKIGTMDPQGILNIHSIAKD